MLRVETASTPLKPVRETASDSALIVMIIKGLHSEKYNAFSTLGTQKDKEQAFSEFKVAFRGFEGKSREFEGRIPDVDDRLLST